MPKRSNDFQKLVYLIQLNLADGAEVAESKLLRDRLTRRLREVDVVVKGSVGHQQVIVSVECRDHKRIADVTWIDAMKAKHDRLPTNVLLLASSKGFTKEATDVAEKYGIGLFTLENQNPESLASLLGPQGTLWHLSYSLTPENVRIRVAKTGELEPETVVTHPDNLVYLEDGQELIDLKELVTNLLNGGYAREYIFKEGREDHIRFELRWEPPSDHLDRPLYMMKLEPRVLRAIECIHVAGPCKIEIGRFGMRSGRFGLIEVAWGKAQIAGHEALAVATISPTGESKLSINVSGSGRAENSA